jgi:hypothetical protein
VGCGSDRLEVSPVRGRVLFKGQGVPRAAVIFFPQGEAAEAVGKIRPFAYADDDGNFQMKTYVDGDGAPPGRYRVSIIAASSAGSGGSGRRIKDGMGQTAPGGRRVQIPPAVTEKFANVDSAGIEVTIEEGENNLSPFELSEGS